MRPCKNYTPYFSWGLKWTKFLNSSLKLEFSLFSFKWFLFLARKYLTVVNLQVIFQFFANVNIHKVAATLVNVVKLDVENDNVVSALFNVVNINFEKDKVDSTFFNVDIRNVVPTMFWRLPISRSHINLTITLKLLIYLFTFNIE